MITFLLIIFINYLGTHGYSQDEDDMKSTLLATGPSFIHNKIESAKHVDLYSLMTHLLGIKPNPNNGSFDALSGMLEKSSLPFVPRESIIYFWSFN